MVWCTSLDNFSAHYIRELRKAIIFIVINAYIHGDGNAGAGVGCRIYSIFRDDSSDSNAIVVIHCTMSFVCVCVRKFFNKFVDLMLLHSHSLSAAVTRKTIFQFYTVDNNDIINPITNRTVVKLPNGQWQWCAKHLNVVDITKLRETRTHQSGQFDRWVNFEKTKKFSFFAVVVASVASLSIGCEWFAS